MERLEIDTGDKTWICEPTNERIQCAAFDNDAFISSIEEGVAEGVEREGPHIVDEIEGQNVKGQFFQEGDSISIMERELD